MAEFKQLSLYLIFNSIHNVMLAEELLLQDDIPVEMVPVPRELSSDCGMSLLCRLSDSKKIELIFAKATFTSEVLIYSGSKKNGSFERRFKLLSRLSANGRQS
jgi:hypothetical protein